MGLVGFRGLGSFGGQGLRVHGLGFPLNRLVSVQCCRTKADQIGADRFRSPVAASSSSSRSSSRNCGEPGVLPVTLTCQHSW